jgi:hypothetical protein
MDFMNRGNPTQPVAPVSHTPHRGGRASKGLSYIRGLRIASVVLLFSATILVVALVGYLMLSGPKNESNYVDSDRLQAVFLNGGQVYFGKIKNLNSDYLRMEDIFYLRVNQVVQPNQSNNSSQQQQNDISLVKLGCELHRPENEMLINREQVIFWENLKIEDGENTVPGAVKKYLAQYPNGQECQAATGNNNSTNNTNSNDNKDDTTNSSTNINAEQ